MILFQKIYKQIKLLIKETTKRRKRNKVDLMRMILIFNKMVKRQSGGHP
jgi:hypothetical protein